MLKANKCMCLLQTIIKILATRTLSRGNEGSREPTDNQSLHNMMRLIEHLKLTFFFPFHIKWNCKKMEKLALIRVSTIGFCYPSSSKRILWYAYLDRVGRWQKKKLAQRRVSTTFKSTFWRWEKSQMQHSFHVCTDQTMQTLVRSRSWRRRGNYWSFIVRRLV